VAGGVLIVDDHEGFRSMARLYLESAGLDVVAEAGDGDEAVTSAIATRPSLALVDINLPGDDGFAVAARLAALDESPRVVLISSRRPGDLDRRLAASPAAGFITKDELSIAAIEALVD
jgi:DNA-binding NarL/FixJ family response regulator